MESVTSKGTEFIEVLFLWTKRQIVRWFFRIQGAVLLFLLQLAGLLQPLLMFLETYKANG